MTPLRKCIYSAISRIWLAELRWLSPYLVDTKIPNIHQASANTNDEPCFILLCIIVKDVAWQESSSPIWKLNQCVGAMLYEDMENGAVDGRIR